MPLRDRYSPALAAALLLGVALGTSIRGFGVVGEVVASWALPEAPPVLVATEPPTWGATARAPHAGDRIGGFLALDAAQVRPLESIALGPLRAPLAVNTYTGGLPDWPSRLLFGLTGSLSAVAALHLAYGAVVVGFLWRVLRLHGAVVAGGAAAIWLASDWSFLFYRRVLGGTEAWLLLASLLLARGIWDRRWRGGGMAPWALALAVGIGLHAKVTFVAVLGGAAVATLATRWDRGPLGAPPPIPPRTLGLAAALCAAFLLPLAIANAHHALAVPEAPHVRSHDYLGLQWDRFVSGLGGLASGGWAPAREQPANLLAWLTRPLSFFERACGADPVPLDAGRVAGLVVVAAGTLLAWRERDDGTQPGALLRWLSLAVPLSAAFLFLLNRDLHHLAMLTALLAMWAGLAVDRVAALVSPPRSPARGRTAALLLAPWVLSGAWAAWRTPAVLETCEARVVLADGQRDLVAMAREADVERLTVVDYDLYGALDVLAPEIDLTHGWGAMSASDDRRGTLADLLRLAVGGHYLAVRPSAPTIYGLDLEEPDLLDLADDAGVRLERVGALHHDGATWARLYRVEPRD